MKLTPFPAEVFWNAGISAAYASFGVEYATSRRFELEPAPLALPPELEEVTAELESIVNDRHRGRGNALRDLGKVREAREAYDQAARLHEGLLRESPNDAGYQVALANTLLNTATLLSRRDHATELEALYRRVHILYEKTSGAFVDCFREKCVTIEAVSAQCDVQVATIERARVD